MGHRPAGWDIRFRVTVWREKFATIESIWFCDNNNLLECWVHSGFESSPGEVDNAYEMGSRLSSLAVIEALIEEAKLIMLYVLRDADPFADFS